ncbi:MAG TPA: cytochrome c peroxidase [Gemmataceae bacterium]|nr:cytochrome c peroxidase [Gemmataceae bacterium]
MPATVLRVGRRGWSAALSAAAIYACLHSPEPTPAAGPATGADRSPVDFVFTPDRQNLFTANQTSNTISVVRLDSGTVAAEISVSRTPRSMALTPDGGRLLVTTSYGGDLTIFDWHGERLTRASTIHLGFEPWGVAVAPDGKRAYVALAAAGAVAVVDLEAFRECARIDVGRWPRSLALSPDGKRLGVGVSGDGGVAVVDTATLKRLFLEDFVGLNLGQMHTSADGKYAYFPWINYRHRPITAGNIRQGWVLASRIARVRLDRPARREAIALDKQGQAVADPCGLALSPDEQWLYCAAAGSHEMLVYRLPGLPWQDYGGPGDHADEKLLADADRFYRIPLGGRPLTVRIGPDGRLVYVANYLLNCIQIVDPAKRAVVRTISLGGPTEPSLARRGEAIFYDGRRSLDQWYSCHSCHYEGHTNAVTMDTLNDGRFGNYKAVLTLRNVVHTGPWTWHGWQTDLEAAAKKSLVDTMLGPTPTAADTKALVAFLGTLGPPPNPFRSPDGGVSDAAKRGEEVFNGHKAACSRCHPAPYYTDGKVHDVGTGEKGDVYKGYNPPSLVGIYDRPMFLHDGRCKSLVQLLTGPHNPDLLNSRGPLSDEELADLVAYLKSL